MLKRLAASEKSSFFEDGKFGEPVNATASPSSANELIHVSRRFSTFPSAGSRRMSAFVGSLVTTVPEILADLFGTLVEESRGGGGSPVRISSTASGAVASSKFPTCIGYLMGR